MDPAKYQSELEKLVTDLALKTREIQKPRRCQMSDRVNDEPV